MKTFTTFTPLVYVALIALEAAWVSNLAVFSSQQLIQVAPVVQRGVSAFEQIPLAGLFGRRRACRVVRPVPTARAVVPPATSTRVPSSDTDPWTDLFDGQTLNGWKETNFGGEGGVTVENGNLVLEMGFPMTGVTYTGELPTTNYEIALEAKRVEGIDFFCGLTFPVDDSYCSFIVGGWAGGVVGLSSIDGRDASENETTSYREFDTDRWYRIRVRVRPERIQAWIDDEPIVDQDIRDARIGIRNEMHLSKPLGLATYETKAALRNIRLRSVGVDP